MRAFTITLILSTIVSLVSWAYRLSVEVWRLEELPFYVLLCLLPLALFAGTLRMMASRRTWTRVSGTMLGIPAFAVWALSVVIGFYGLRIH
jgi:hypothetical protein